MSDRYQLTLCVGAANDLQRVVGGDRQWGANDFHVYPSGDLLYICVCMLYESTQSGFSMVGVERRHTDTVVHVAA